LHEAVVLPSISPGTSSAARSAALDWSDDASIALDRSDDASIGVTALSGPPASAGPVSDAELHAMQAATKRLEKIEARAILMGQLAEQ
jgi:hypothetical protein